MRSTLPAHLRDRLSTARELERRRPPAGGERLAFGLPALDRLLGGGLPRGELVELVGGRSSGRFSAVVAALAAATAGGEAAALVDLGSALDPGEAERAGVELERLLWVRPRRTGEALAAAEHLLAGGLPLVVLDLGTPPVPGGRGPEASWVRLARAAGTHGGALLVASPYRAAGTAATRVVRARRRRAAWTPAPGPRLLTTLSARLRLEKGSGPPSLEAVSLRLFPAPALPFSGSRKFAAPSGAEPRAGPRADSRDGDRGGDRIGDRIGDRPPPEPAFRAS